MQKTKSPITLRIVSATLLIGWMGLIFYLSHQNATESADLSGGLIECAVKLFFPNATSSFITQIITAVEFLVRKLAHFCIYGVLGILSFLTLVTYKTMPFVLRCFLSFLICGIYSLSDEYHQTFIAGRSGELRDVLIDCGGALTGIIFSALIYGLAILIKKKREPKMKKKEYIELSESLQHRLYMERNASMEVKTENAQLLKENADLNEQLNELRRRIVELENAQCFNHTENSAQPEADTQINGTEPEESEESILHDTCPQLSDSVNMGAEIIGKIVLSSAEYCNSLSGAAAPANAKELLNLILGRTEVAKAEILRISSLDISKEEMLSAMERELAEAEDYFKSVMAQKTL